MKKCFKGWLFLFITAFLLSGLFDLFTGRSSIQLMAAEKNITQKAVLVDFDGDLEIQKPGAKDWTTPAKKEQLGAGSRIKVGKNSFCMLLLSDGSTVKLGENTLVRVVSLDKQKPRWKLIVGRIWLNINRVVGGKTNFEVETPNALAAVPGTIFEIRTDGKKDLIVVFTGIVEVQSESQKILVEDLFQVDCEKDGFIGKMEKIDPTKLDKWQKWNLSIDWRIAPIQGRMAMNYHGIEYAKGARLHWQEYQKDIKRFNFEGSGGTAPGGFTPCTTPGPIDGGEVTSTPTYTQAGNDEKSPVEKIQEIVSEMGNPFKQK